MSSPTTPQLEFPGELRTLRLSLTEPTPPALFVCSAKIRTDVGQALKGHFETGAELTRDIKREYLRHLSYCCGLGEQFYEAGPAADFAEILFIYRTAGLAEARTLMEADPFYREGVFFDPWYFEWHIHSPIYKSSMPAMPEQVVEFTVHETTPQTLIVGFGDFNLELAMKSSGKTDHMAIFHLLHVAYRHGVGGLGPMGIDWGVGPAGPGKSLHILNVPSVSVAKLYNEMDAACRWGIMSNFRYFEWCIHYPIRKASPRHRPALRNSLVQGGIKISEE